MIHSIQAEKERRLKEKNQANTKRFMDERKNTAMKQNKRREKQKKLHETQLQDISTFVKSVSITIGVKPRPGGQWYKKGYYKVLFIKTTNKNKNWK